MTRRKVKVIFRNWHGVIIAILPNLVKDKVCTYMESGQHSETEKYIIGNMRTKPAKESEYAKIKKELEALGYNLEVKTTF